MGALGRCPLIAIKPLATSINPLAEVDLTDYVGTIVDATTWAGLQAECKRRHGKAWSFRAQQIVDDWYIAGVDARCE